MGETDESIAVEEGNPIHDERAFRRCLAQFGTGVTVVTTTCGDEPLGLTANSFSSVSLDPPLVLWCIGCHSRRFAEFTGASEFAINVLASDQVELSRIFSSTDTDRFGRVDWHLGGNGAPILAGAIGALECSVDTVHQAGDHAIIIGKVSRYARRPGAALLYLQGRYAIAEDHPAAKRTEYMAVPDNSVNTTEPSSLSTLLFRSYRTISNGFTKYRREERLTFSQSRILFGLGSSPGQTIEDLAKAFYLSTRAAEDAVNDLIEQGLVKLTAGNVLKLTERGRDRRNAVQERMRRYEAEKLKGFSSKEVDGTKRLLSTIISAG